MDKFYKSSQDIERKRNYDGRTDGQTHGRTDRQNDRQPKSKYSPPFSKRAIIMSFSSQDIEQKQEFFIKSRAITLVQIWGK